MYSKLIIFLLIVIIFIFIKFTSYDFENFLIDEEELKKIKDKNVLFKYKEIQENVNKFDRASLLTGDKLKKYKSKSEKFLRKKTLC